MVEQRTPDVDCRSAGLRGRSDLDSNCIKDIQRRENGGRFYVLGPE